VLSLAVNLAGTLVAQLTYSARLRSMQKNLGPQVANHPQLHLWVVFVEIIKQL
jgi:hypothetical protein